VAARRPVAAADTGWATTPTAPSYTRGSTVLPTCPSCSARRSCKSHTPRAACRSRTFPSSSTDPRSRRRRLNHVAAAERREHRAEAQRRAREVRRHRPLRSGHPRRAQVLDREASGRRRPASDRDSGERDPEAVGPRPRRTRRRTKPRTRPGHGPRAMWNRERPEGIVCPCRRRVCNPSAARIARRTLGKLARLRRSVPHARCAHATAGCRVATSAPRPPTLNSRLSTLDSQLSTLNSRLSTLDFIIGVLSLP